jgi:hypothetical protein
MSALKAAGGPRSIGELAIILRRPAYVVAAAINISSSSSWCGRAGIAARFSMLRRGHRGGSGTQSI